MSYVLCLMSYVLFLSTVVFNCQVGVEPSTRNGLEQIEGDADEDAEAGSTVAIQLPQLFHPARIWGPADRRRNLQTTTHVSAQDNVTSGGRPCITNVWVRIPPLPD